MLKMIKEMTIDEDKEIGLYRQAPEKGKGKVVYSDHNMIRVVMKINEPLNLR